MKNIMFWVGGILESHVESQLDRSLGKLSCIYSLPNFSWWRLLEVILMSRRGGRCCWRYVFDWANGHYKEMTARSKLPLSSRSFRCRLVGVVKCTMAPLPYRHRQHLTYEAGRVCLSSVTSRLDKRWTSPSLGAGLVISGCISVVVIIRNWGR